MTLQKFLGSFGAVLAVLFLQTACIDVIDGSSVSGTTLYVFDGASGQVLAWDDAGTVYDATALPSASRTLSSSSLSQVKALGWGGMTMDPTRNALFLISAAGKVVRIDRVRSQSGTLTSTNDIALFTLGSSGDRLNNGVFGQAAVDSTTGTLYVTESNDTDSHVWVVSNPGSISDGTTVSLNQIRSTSGTDTKASGVAAAQGNVCAYFGGGDNVINNGISYSGARIRRGSGSSFEQVLVYGDATLGTVGSLGLDSSNSLLYVLRRNASGAVEDPPIVVYKLGRFTSGYDQAHDAALGSAKDQADLRFLTHAGNKDWLGGADMDSGTSAGTSNIWLWRNPSTGGAPKVFSLTNGQVLGIAFDGSN